MRKLLSWLLPPVVLVAAGVTLFVTQSSWEPSLRRILGRPTAEESAAHDDHAHEDHGDHGTTDSITLSEQARSNMRLETGPVARQEYWRVIAVPGIVVESPGRSEHTITTRIPGIVRQVYVAPGQAIQPGAPLFEIEITGEAITQAQSSLLRTMARLQVNQRELERITPLVEQGAVAEKTRLELDYERQRLQADATTSRQELRLHGLSDEQVEAIGTGRALLQRVTVAAPTQHFHRTPAQSQDDPDRPEFLVEDIDVIPGSLVNSGDPLAHITDHSYLFIRGLAFERESEAITKAAEEDWPISAEFELGGATPLVRRDLQILYADNTIAVDTRTFYFYLPLKNEVLKNKQTSDGRVYRSWRYKPGQKALLRVPVERWVDQIVVPAEAVTTEGPMAYVFLVSGNNLIRREVAVLYMDGQNAVLRDDGSVFPGETIALNNAYSLNLALKQKAGGGADPHAGHMH